MSRNVNDKFIILVNKGSTSSMPSLYNQLSNASRVQNLFAERKTKPFTSFFVSVQNSFKVDLNFGTSWVPCKESSWSSSIFHQNCCYTCLAYKKIEHLTQFIFLRYGCLLNVSLLIDNDIVALGIPYYLKYWSDLWNLIYGFLGRCIKLFNTPNFHCNNR